MSSIKILLSFVPQRFHAPFLDELSKINFNPSEAEELLGEMNLSYLSDSKKREIIIEEVCTSFNITRVELMDKTNKPCITLPRQVAMVATYFCTEYSMAQTGAFFGKDHSTVSHAQKVVHNMHDTDREFRTVIGGIMGRLQSRGVTDFEKFFNKQIHK